MPYNNTRVRRSTSVYNSRNHRARKPKNQKQYINPARFIKAAEPAKQLAQYIPQNTFADFGLDERIMRNLTNNGIITPTPIQDMSIAYGLEGKDVVGIANTGTGKTAAFAVPLLNRLMNDRQARALIMAPTRELAQQIEADCRMIASGSGISGALLIGGSAMGPQLKDLRANPQIVIGTPGRIKDHTERGTLKLQQFSAVVLDEADRMLDMGFINDIRTILGMLATPRQSYFFSATVDERVQGLIRTFLNEPVTVSVKTGDTSDQVEQNIVQYSSNQHKIDKLHDLLISGEVAKSIIFDETQRSVERLHKELAARGFKSDAIHGGKTQGQRQRALQRFRDNQINVLVATDVAARGIDVADITHVINYSTPQTYDDYIHRIGRAGRAGRKGYALTFIEQNR